MRTSSNHAISLLPISSFYPLTKESPSDSSPSAANDWLFLGSFGLVCSSRCPFLLQQQQQQQQQPAYLVFDTVDSNRCSSTFAPCGFARTIRSCRTKQVLSPECDSCAPLGPCQISFFRKKPPSHRHLDWPNRRVNICRLGARLFCLLDDRLLPSASNGANRFGFVVRYLTTFGINGFSGVLVLPGSPTFSLSPGCGSLGVLQSALLLSAKACARHLLVIHFLVPKTPSLSSLHLHAAAFSIYLYVIFGADTAPYAFALGSTNIFRISKT
jgi:hypothetical protein